jgi:hypothetical protein
MYDGKNAVDGPLHIEIIIHGSVWYSMSERLSLENKALWSVEKMRQSHKNHQKRLGIRISKRGLQELVDDDITAKENEKIRKYILCNEYSCQEKSIQKKYYIFNWSGKLDDINRKSASLLLYKDICALRKKYPNALISLIGYSHGGNVALGIVDWVAIFHDYNFQIDYLFLMGTPIGKQTKRWALAKRYCGIPTGGNLVCMHGDYFESKGYCDALSKYALKKNNYIFKSIINLYHQKDYIQVADLWFDFAPVRTLIIPRKDVFNIESRFDAAKISRQNSSKWYHLFDQAISYLKKYHTHFLEEGFFCDLFIKIKNNYESFSEN